VSEHRARKRFGQNFLHDREVVARIVAAIAPRADDRLVEIGPGLGALTAPLLERLDHLQVIELDRDLIARLRQRFSPDVLTLHEGDALRFDFSSLGAPLRVVGNLPYNISTPLLFHLADHACVLKDMTFMLQKEVVSRIVAEPGSKDFGRLSVMLQYRFRVGHLFDVPPEAFRPAPKIMSSIVRLIPLVEEQRQRADDEALFRRLVAAAFAQRRKTLRNTLRDFLAVEDFATLELDPGLRAERLSVADYVRISNYLSASAANA